MGIFVVFAVMLPHKRLALHVHILSRLLIVVADKPKILSMQILNWIFRNVNVLGLPFSSCPYRALRMKVTKVSSYDVWVCRVISVMIQWHRLGLWKTFAENDVLWYTMSQSRSVNQFETITVAQISWDITVWLFSLWASEQSKRHRFIA